MVPINGSDRRVHWLSRLSWLRFGGVVVRSVNMHEAKTHLSRLVDEAAAGQSFVICKAGRPMVRVMPIDSGDDAALTKRRLGLLVGQCEVPDDFDQLAAAEIADWFERG